MKILIYLISFLPILSVVCIKDDELTCAKAEVVLLDQSCDQWGIKLAATVSGPERTYPSANVPNVFRLTGKKVCVQYNLYDDTSTCNCCGGKWMNIVGIKNF